MKREVKFLLENNNWVGALFNMIYKTLGLPLLVLAVYNSSWIAELAIICIFAFWLMFDVRIYQDKGLLKR